MKTLTKQKAEKGMRIKDAPINNPIKDGPNALCERNQKLLHMAKRIGIDPDSPQILKLWEEVKYAEGFQIRKKRGGGRKNTPGETWVKDMYDLSRVAEFMHKSTNISKTKAAELLGISPTHISRLTKIGGKYELFWKSLMASRPTSKNRHMHGAEVAARNRQFFGELYEKQKQ